MRAAVLGLALALSLVLAACSPYDPSLPSTPFLCATDEPRCPDGFTCVTDGKQQVCRASGAATDAGVDSAPSSAPGTTPP